MADANSGMPRERCEPFADRRAAGRLLAPLLATYANQPNTIVLGLPRGGIPVAFEVAVALHAPLDTFAVRKLGVPAQEELALGAISSGGAFVINRDVMRDMQISRAELLHIMERERRELERREHAYRGRRPYPPLTGKTVILADDGMATGASMLVAIRALRINHPAKIVIAVPVAPPRTCALIGKYARVVCYAMPEPFGGVGVWYDDFSQTSDEEVCALLERAATRPVDM